MLTIKQILDDPQGVIERLAVKHFPAEEPIAAIIAQDKLRRDAQHKKDDSLAQQKVLSRSIGEKMKAGAREEAEQLKAEVQALKEVSKQAEETMRQAEETMRQLLLSVPNLPHPDVPHGTSAEDNLCVATGGKMPHLENTAKLPHWELAKQYDLIDFELGVKITGAGFPVYKGRGARLQRALINFFLDRATAAGFQEVEPPIMVNEASGIGTGQLPDKEGQMYQVQLDNLYLIPTAEVPVTNIFRDVILEADQLPICCTAYTPCFRREAGSYGKDVRGLNRLHQFDKVEIVSIDRPDHSWQQLDKMIAHVKSLVEELELPYRILRLCGGDLSFTSAMTYDFEVFSAAQERWLEVSSVSNFESYQANRLMCRYRDPEEGITLCHTLNGSALALPRIVAALLENNQTPEGIIIPKALRPYTGFDKIDYAIVPIHTAMAKKGKQSARAINIRNKRATYDYELLDQYTAGIVLVGSEIKSIRAGKAALVDSYCYFSRGELWIKNMYIAEYSYASYNNHVERRERKLLLNRKELRKLEEEMKNPGQTIIPVRLFINERGLAKLVVALARGKKQYDKRAAIRDREDKRRLERAMRF